jgi:methylglutamate dehydrogenase subunit C
MSRLASGGRIDRSKRLRFRFDGLSYWGYPGDTLASALLANDIKLVGRSFKYHRPRGIFSAGPEEPNALVELRQGARREPNTRATVVELYPELWAESQNRFPSLRFDLMSLNGLAAPFLSAGFYYKTFMWPQKFWEKVYEPIIRRAAGLGRGPTEPDPDHYEAAHLHCDILVVGSGAAGLAAARAAGSTGARVVLAEQDFELGGGLLREPAHEVFRTSCLAALAGMPEVRLMPRTTVFGAYDHGVFGAVERLADHLAEPAPHIARQRYWTIRAKHVVLATGAFERFIAFPNNDLPGVMLAGSAATYATRFGVLPGQAAVLFANHDAAYADAFALQDAGALVRAIIDPRADSSTQQEARARGITVRSGSEIVGAIGASGGVSGVRTRAQGSVGWDNTYACDLLMVAGGWNPAVHLASQNGTPLLWHHPQASFVPGIPKAHEKHAGSLTGTQGIGPCAAEGFAAGHAAATACGFAAPAAFALPEAPALDATVQPLWEVRAPGKAFVDIQDDVTPDDMRLAHQEGFTHIEHAKRYTTHAMGTDQGKTGGLVGAAILAEARGEPISTVGLSRFRPYATPVTWGAIAGEHVGKHFAPTRRTALHAWHEANGAVFMEAGPWLRPAYYPAKQDADAWASVIREARVARSQVAVCDVSTLGKIAVSGPDAAKFLDLLYANTFSTLPVGRARYGLMLREDGHVFDDGTTSRTGEHEYFVTTTTANAVAVMAHMEFHHQTAWPELDVSYVSVTDQWAAMSICGPRARDVVAAVVDLDVSNQAFPFMGVADCRAAGAPGKLFRISFSGELAYEIAVPAGYAEHVWKAVMAAGAPHGIIPYGVEALGLMRIEKGHVAGSELNGNTTAHDLGLGRMLKKNGDFIGRVLAGRPGMTDPARPCLVGLRPVNRKTKLYGGMHLVEKYRGTESLGWVTAVTRGVEVEGWLGLAMLKHGKDRIGQVLHATSPVHGVEFKVEICSPHFVDPENLRVRT